MITQGTALVVDDNRSTASSWCARLETLGLEVLQAENGLEALDVLAAHPRGVDVVLLTSSCRSSMATRRWPP